MPNIFKVLVSLLSTLKVFDMLFFFDDFEYINEILYCLHLNLSMHFRVGSRSLVPFKMELYVTSVNNSFQWLPNFCYKELHLRCCIEPESNIVTSTKILKGIGGTPLSLPDRVQSQFFALKVFGIWYGLNGVHIPSSYWHKLWLW